MCLQSVVNSKEMLYSIRIILNGSWLFTNCAILDGLLRNTNIHLQNFSWNYER